MQIAHNALRDNNYKRCMGRRIGSFRYNAKGDELFPKLPDIMGLIRKSSWKSRGGDITGYLQ